jgi:hypothetical protein
MGEECVDLHRRIIMGKEEGASVALRARTANDVLDRIGITRTPPPQGSEADNRIQIGLMKIEQQFVKMGIGESADAQGNESPQDLSCDQARRGIESEGCQDITVADGQIVEDRPQAQEQK